MAICSPCYLTSDDDGGYLFGRGPHNSRPPTAGLLAAHTAWVSVLGLFMVLLGMFLVHLQMKEHGAVIFGWMFAVGGTAFGAMPGLVYVDRAIRTSRAMLAVVMVNFVVMLLPWVVWFWVCVGRPAVKRAREQLVKKFRSSVHPDMVGTSELEGDGRIVAVASTVPHAAAAAPAPVVAQPDPVNLERAAGAGS